MEKKNKFIIIILIMVFVLILSSSAFADDLEITETPKEGEYILVETKQEVLRVSASETSGLHSVVLGVIGDYNPIVKDYTYQNYNGTTQHSIEISPDWSWIASAFIFVVIIFCVFRFLGGLFSK